jgi:hypothetical protein
MFVAKPNHSFIAFLALIPVAISALAELIAKVWSLSRVFGYGWGALHITRMVHTVINTETVA